MKNFIASFFLVIVASVSLIGCGTPTAEVHNQEQSNEAELGGLKVQGNMELEYANQFEVKYCEGGYSLVIMADGDRYLIVPENAEVPKGLSADIKVINQPLRDLYLASPSAMDLFDKLGQLDKISFTSTKADSCFIDGVVRAMKSGEISYIGKYDTPDYEALIEGDCPVAIESSMIYHNPEVKGMLESQGITVFTERSSYEAYPLGRLEWIKLFALMAGEYEKGERFYNEEKEIVKEIEEKSKANDSSKSIAFFYIGSNGSVNVRKSDDYICKMLEMAGGKYIFNSENLKVEDSSISTNLQFEAFYEYGKDADIIIYNGTIGGGINSVRELLDKNELFADFKAVKEDNVWCCGKNIYQQPTATAQMLEELSFIIGGVEDREYKFFKKLK